ncbi:MAG: hypothetical protein RBR48_04515, partial [Bacilli bacterium]|nr:hypothetical protein [Bacilli bacterium]
MKRSLLLINLLILILFLSGCTKQQSKLYDLNFSMYYNTVNNVKIIAASDSEAKLEEIYQGIDEILLRIDQLFNIQVREEQYKTELMIINDNAGVKPVQVSNEVITVVKKALE